MQRTDELWVWSHRADELNVVGYVVVVMYGR